ncbi:MAG: Wzz/FepE/Etk N-terminal domain-containing protein [Chitinophagales bacterium]
MLEILKIVLKWKKQILLFTIVAAIASIIITMPFIMPPYYKSISKFYLSNPSSTDRSALFNEKEVAGVNMFGGKEDINRFLTILNSAPVSLSVIQKYNLGKHYDIKADNQELFTYYTQKEFYNNFNAVRNDLGAIEVSVVDTDNKLACKIVNDVVAISDSIYRTILVENKSTVIELLNKQIAEKTAQMASNASVAVSDDIKKLIAIRDQYAVSSSKDFKTIFIVEEPSPAVKKTKPVRWLILLASTIAAFVLSSLVALLLELYKHADKYGFQRS